MITIDLLMKLMMTFSLMSGILITIGFPFLAKGDVDNSKKFEPLGRMFFALGIVSMILSGACLITSIWIE